MAALQRGDLKTALDYLGRSTPFNAAYDALNNMQIITVNPQAISIIQAGVTVKYDFKKNVKAFKDYCDSAREGTFEPRILWLALALNYEYLLISGRRSTLQVGQGGVVTTSNTTKLSGTGHAASVTPQIALGASAWRTPMEVIIHANLGYRQWGLNNTDGSFVLGNKTFYVGVIGTQINFPGRTGRKNIVRISNVGAGVVSDVKNPYVFMTFAGNWLQGNKISVRSTVTPIYRYLLGEHQPGVEATVADITWRVGPNGRYAIGIGAKGSYTARIIGNRVIHSLSGSGEFRFNFLDNVSFTVEAGYRRDVGGPSANRLPGTPYFTGNLRLRFPWQKIRKVPKSTK